MIAESINLVSINATVFRVFHCGVLVQGPVDFIRQSDAARGCRLIMSHLLEHLSRLTQTHHGKEIRRDQERKNGRVVAWTKHRKDEADRFGWKAVTTTSQRIRLHLSAPLEPVGPLVVLALLLAKGAQDVGDRIFPGVIEGRRIAS